MRTNLFFISILRAASGPRMKLASCKSALKPSVVYSTDRSRSVVPVSFFTLSCFAVYSTKRFVSAVRVVILFLCFSVL